jgi:hypothetical protein
MDDTAQQQAPSTDDQLNAQREIIRQSLDEIANDFGMAMRDSNLNYPVGLAIPSSGHSIATVVTPVDPSDADWDRTMAIARRIISKKLGDIRLRTRPLSCAVVNAPMIAAEVAGV